MNNNRKDIVARIECYRLLKDCVCLEHIESKDIIINNLNKIQDYYPDLPKTIVDSIEDFINDAIKPIIFDLNYFDFLIRDEWGEYNSEGHFEIKSEGAFESMLFLLYARTIDLAKLVDEFAEKHLHIELNKE